MSDINATGKASSQQFGARKRSTGGGGAEGEKRPAGVISLCMVPFLSLFVLFFFFLNIA